MKEDWPKSIEFVLKMEGGDEVENNPADPGGQTKFGISKKAYPSLDVAHLTRPEAEEIYRRDYWTPCACDDLPWPFSIAVFDCAVNQGPVKAKRLLQMALDMDTVDGVIGAKTLAAAAKASPYRLKKMLALRLAEYARTMAEHQNLLVFAVDWSYRVLSLLEAANGCDHRKDGRERAWHRRRDRRGALVP